jgi:hypothetical protein
MTTAFSPRRVGVANLVTMLFVLTACGSQPAQEHPRSRTVVTPATARTPSIAWTFRPRPEERRRIDSITRHVAGMASGPDRRHGVAIYRAPSMTAQERYLLVASRDTTPPPEVLGERENLLYMIIADQAGDPLRVRTSPESSIPFALSDVRDFDADGLADVAYCTDGSEESGGTLSIVGYRTGAWYRITPQANHGLCK